MSEQNLIEQFFEQNPIQESISLSEEVFEGSRQYCQKVLDLFELDSDKKTQQEKIDIYVSICMVELEKVNLDTEDKIMFLNEMKAYTTTMIISYLKSL